MGLKQWCKKHPVLCGIAGGIVIGGTGAYLGYKYHDRISDFFSKTFVNNDPVLPIVIANAVEPEAIIEAASEIPSLPTSFTVGSFVRKLPEGCSPSSEKLRTAVENGFENLPEGYTWVRDYIKGKTA